MADNKLIINNLISTFSEIYRLDTLKRFEKYIQETKSKHLLNSVKDNDLEELRRLIKLTVIVQALAMKVENPKSNMRISIYGFLDDYLKQHPELQTIFVDFEQAIDIEFDVEEIIWSKYISDKKNQGDTENLQTILIDKFKDIVESDEFKKFEPYIKASKSLSLLDPQTSDSKEELKRLIKLSVIVKVLAIKIDNPEGDLTTARYRLLDQYLEENPELQTIYIDFDKAIDFNSYEEDDIWDQVLVDNKNQGDTENIQTLLIDKFKNILESAEFKKFEPYIKASKSLSLLDPQTSDSKEELKRLIKLSVIVQALAMKADNAVGDLTIARYRLLDQYLEENPELQTIYIDFKTAINFKICEEDYIWEKVLIDNKNQGDTENLQTLLIDKFKNILESTEFKKFEPYIKASKSISLLDPKTSDSKEELKRLIKLSVVVQALAMKADNAVGDLTIARYRLLDQYLEENPELQTIYIDFNTAINFNLFEEDSIWRNYVESMQKKANSISQTLDQQRSVVPGQHGSQEKEDSSDKEMSFSRKA